MSQRAQQLLEQPLLDHGAVDVRSARRLTYVLRQSFRYDYDGPVRGLQQRLVVVPTARHGSARRVMHRLRTSAPRAVVSVRRERTGNVVALATVPRVSGSVAFELVAVVERRGPWTDHLLPPGVLEEARWRRPTLRTAADDAVRELASGLDGRDPREVAEQACARVHAALPYEFGRTSPGTTAAEALTIGRGVCQDHAHVMLAVCRSVGVPARYVSGHLLGQGGTHAWVEVLVADRVEGRDVTRAVALDPCNGCGADPRYLTVATGRDYGDVAPVSGSYHGSAVGRLTASQQVGIAEAA
jgi:transglutaminase-like putative cysteine protease